MDVPCDECSLPAVGAAHIEFDDVVIERPLCREHLDGLLRGARPMFDPITIERSDGR